MAGHDHETHARLLNAAAELFAARGFKDVTVREISAAARANLAAVNYHFGGKLGLYQQVVSKAIDTMRATNDAARAAGVGLSPEEKLRAYVRVFLRRVGSDGQDSWIHRMMAREIADPTPALDRIAEQVIAPRIEYIASVVSDITGRDAGDDVVRRCALSVQSQCHAAMPHPLATRALRLSTDAASIDELAEHIANFSLAGIREVQGVQKVQKVQKVQRVQEVRRVHKVHRGA
jgi:TetR/AcrR family transcriptional regulator, regulator of cefoperazone and chloramphenicol sensitivity